MSTKLKINITKEVLQRSMYCNTPLAQNEHGSSATTNCAIALAIWDIIPNVRVMSDSIVFYKTSINSEPISYLSGCSLPPIASSFIKIFDMLVRTPLKRLELEPISFEIDIPDEVIDNISIEEITERLKDCKTVKLV